jgi:hypothetical protein
MKNHKCIYSIYFEVQFWYCIAPRAMSLVIIGHANHVQKLCGDFQQLQRVLGNHVEFQFQGAKHISKLLLMERI